MSATELWPYLALIVAGFLPNEIWRWLGLLAARGLEEDSQIIVWVRAVATAVLAGVIAQLISTSSGVLATIPLSVRIAAALLFLTPLSLVMSVSRNSRQLIDRVALVLGLVIGPVLASMKVGLDLLWTGMIAGTIAYVVHRLHEAWHERD